MEVSRRIQLLEERVANQIAAGEVVERPASIVKEFLENAIDAGATKITIDIEKGGIARIAIQDNGTGIVKEDLPLALARHATSKIMSSEDLFHIKSLGFRGEALASICSVSHLVLQSRTANAESGWQIVAEGGVLSPRIVPVAHPLGTTLEVRDIFFNLPARRKFLRSEKMEFIHIEDIVKKIALSCRTVTIHLTHNGRTCLKVPSLLPAEHLTKRIQAVCGKPFIENSCEVEFAAVDLKLQGFISIPEYSRSQTDLQYFFLNGRVIRDKLISHAIRQAYEPYVHPGRYPCYVLYLTVDPATVDVNVHPTKSEVRFRESHLIHDFILYRLSSLLSKVPLSMVSPKVELPMQPIAQPPLLKVAETQPAYQLAAQPLVRRIQHIVDRRFVIYLKHQQLYCLDLIQGVRQQIQQLAIAQNPVLEPKPLLFPEPVVGVMESQGYEATIKLLMELGLTLKVVNNRIVINAMPLVLHWLDKTTLHDELMQLFKQIPAPTKSTVIEKLVQTVSPDLVLSSEDQGLLIAVLEATDTKPPILCELTAARLETLLTIGEY